jgi:hypothetical protein
MQQDQGHRMLLQQASKVAGVVIVAWLVAELTSVPKEAVQKLQSVWTG